MIARGLLHQKRPIESQKALNKILLESVQRNFSLLLHRRQYSTQPYWKAFKFVLLIRNLVNFIPPAKQTINACATAWALFVGGNRLTRASYKQMGSVPRFFWYWPHTGQSVDKVCIIMESEKTFLEELISIPADCIKATVRGVDMQLITSREKSRLLAQDSNERHFYIRGKWSPPVTGFV